MLRTRILVVSLLGLGLLGGTAAQAGPDGPIARAAAALYQDVLRRNAAALCSDITPSEAAQLVPSSAPGAACEAAASAVFASTAPNEPSPAGEVSVGATVKQLELSGRHATATVLLTHRRILQRPGRVVVRIRSVGALKLEL